MRGVLAAEDRAGLGHHLLDERVADAGADRRAAELADDLGDGLRADQVVHDRLARVPVEDRRRRAIAVVVEPDTGCAWSSTRNDAVGVAVEREPDVGAARRAPRAGGPSRFSGWIGSAGWFGNVPSSSPKSIVELERQAGEHRGDDEAAHAVGGVGDDAERRAARRRRRTSARGATNVGEQVARARPGPGSSARSSSPPATVALISAEPGVLADRRGAGPAQLDAVVLRPGCGWR